MIMFRNAPLYYFIFFIIFLFFPALSLMYCTEQIYSNSYIPISFKIGKTVMEYSTDAF